MTISSATALRFNPMPVASQGSVFGLLFGPLLTRLQPLHWLVASDCFSWPCDWTEAQHDAVEAQWTRFGQFHLIDTAFLSRHVEYVSDFWNELYGFESRSTDWEPWVAQRFVGGEMEQQRFVAQTTDVVFLNVDASYWEFHAKKTELLQILLQRWPGAREVLGVYHGL